MKRDRKAEGKTIDCVKELVDLVAGREVPEEKQFDAFVHYMISHSYFFKVETVNARHDVIVNWLQRGEKLPARYMTKSDCYFDSIEGGKILRLKNKNYAVRKTHDKTVYYGKGWKCRIPIVIDRDGNKAVRNLIRSASGAVVSQGDKQSNVRSAVISHLWGNAYNPIFFTNLWNIVIVPAYLNPILDKNEGGEDGYQNRLVNYVKACYKNLCYDLYRMDEKIKVYERYMPNIRNEFCCIRDVRVVPEIVHYIEDLGFLAWRNGRSGMKRMREHCQ